MGVSSSHVVRALLIALTLLLVGLARPAAASSPYLVLPSDEVRQASPAYRYANLSDEEAYSELSRRGVPYVLAGTTKGVRAPVRLTGPLHGVHVHSSLPLEQRATTMFEILDARLALSLDDFCALLERHDIVELVHYTMYRPNGPKPGLEHVAGKRKGKRKGKRSTTSKRSGKRKGLGKGTKQPKRRARTSKKPSKKKSGATKKKGTTKKKSASKKKSSKNKTATKSKRKGRRKGKAVSRKKSSSKKRARNSRKRSDSRRGKKKPVKKSSYAAPGTRHPAGLAIDVGGLRKRDGRWLSVAHHFQGRIGARTCGANANPPKSPQARELWSIVCEAADLGLFTYVLTPNYDAPHADHFHMEIRGDVKWFLYH